MTKIRKIFALGAVCVVLSASTSFAFSAEQQALLQAEQAAFDTTARRNAGGGASITTKEGSVFIKGKGVSFGITGLDDAVTVNEIVENIAGNFAATVELKGVLDKCAVHQEEGDTCHGKTDPELVKAFSALSEYTKELDAKLAATTLELTVTKTELAHTKAELNAAAAKSADDVSAIRKELQLQWTPLGAYRKFPGKDCATIKKAMFDTGNG